MLARVHRTVAAPAALPAPGRPLIEEIGAGSARGESDASSEGSAANHLLASVDTLHPWFDAAGAAEDPVQGASTMELLELTITSVVR